MADRKELNKLHCLGTLHTTELTIDSKHMNGHERRRWPKDLRYVRNDVY